MRDIKYIKNAIISTTLGALILVGAAFSASAQTNTREYRDWQREQQRAEQRHQTYMRTQRSRDYNQWQAAQRRAQERYLIYQRMYGNNGYNNNTYYNNSRYNVGRYRVYNNGAYYVTDSRGAEYLRQAIRNGYSQGYRQGMTDRRYGRGYNFYGNNIYTNGMFGYNSYVASNQYQYYFQQGFQRGYEDGFYSRSNYGYRSGNGFTIAAGILNTILNLTNNP